MDAFVDSPNGPRHAFISGYGLTPEGAKERIKRIEAKPEDWFTRSELMTFCAAHLHRNSQGEDAAVVFEQLKEQVLWFLDNQPENEAFQTCLIAFNDTNGVFVKSLRERLPTMSKQKKASPAVLRNFRIFLITRNPTIPPSKTERLLKTGQSDANRVMSMVWALKTESAKNGEPRSEGARKAMEILDGACGVATDSFQLEYLRTWLATNAYDAGDIEKAAETARLLLSATVPESETAPIVINTAYTYLGLVALQAGDVEHAKFYLNNSLDDRTHYVLSSFGPLIELADQLLAAGQKDAVRAYLEKCRVIWKSRADKVSRWIDEIDAGKTPKLSRYGQ